MKSTASSNNSSKRGSDSTIKVYECEVTLKFHIIEEDFMMKDKEHLLENLVDAFTYGNDEFLETLKAQVQTQAISEVEASPQLRRQLIRLRNSGN
jgi:hypothetical protein